jgi:hypothetical protein
MIEEIIIARVLAEHLIGDKQGIPVCPLIHGREKLKGLF